MTQLREIANLKEHIDDLQKVVGVDPQMTKPEFHQHFQKVLEAFKDAHAALEALNHKIDNIEIARKHGR